MQPLLVFLAHAVHPAASEPQATQAHPLLPLSERTPDDAALGEGVADRGRVEAVEARRGRARQQVLAVEERAVESLPGKYRVPEDHSMTIVRVSDVGPLPSAPPDGSSV